MLSNLSREDFIELLNKLGMDDDDDVLTAARDLHARITVAGIAWDDLLVPEEDPDAEDEDEYEDDEDAAAPGCAHGENNTPGGAHGENTAWRRTQRAPQGQPRRQHHIRSVALGDGAPPP